MRRKGRWLAALFLLLLVLSLPLLLNLNVFRNQVHRAVERQLGRTVEFGSLTARLLPRPGMVGQRVMVYEHEDFGAEPFLYADEVRCDLALSSLWTMRLEFANIHFVRPSINLVRRPDGAWNLGSFLLTGGDGAPVLGKTPAVSATEARINVKLGVDKQLYGLRGARLRLTPRAEGRWGFELQATPFRTDTQLPETGEVHLEGEVGRGPTFSALPFRFRVGLERGSLAQLWALATGWEPPVRALASLDATLEGTPAEWNSKGMLTIANLRRWD
ncbi:MAG TPA: AsmA family protein, partial [Candidatus Acidoferrales bacterium]|nr:AsmA family protein [Candidatus Acidoferrales bacterium]